MCVRVCVCGSNKQVRSTYCNHKVPMFNVATSRSAMSLVQKDIRASGHLDIWTLRASPAAGVGETGQLVHNASDNDQGFDVVECLVGCNAFRLIQPALRESLFCYPACRHTITHLNPCCLQKVWYLAKKCCWETCPVFPVLGKEAVGPDSIRLHVDISPFHTPHMSW